MKEFEITNIENKNKIIIINLKHTKQQTFWDKLIGRKPETEETLIYYDEKLNEFRNSEFELIANMYFNTELMVKFSNALAGFSMKKQLEE